MKYAVAILLLLHFARGSLLFEGGHPAEATALACQDDCGLCPCHPALSQNWAVSLQAGHAPVQARAGVPSDEEAPVSPLERAPFRPPRTA